MTPFAALGSESMEKQAFGRALGMAGKALARGAMSAGRVALPHLQQAGGSLMRGVSGAASAAKPHFSAAGRVLGRATTRGAQAGGNALRDIIHKNPVMSTIAGIGAGGLLGGLYRGNPQGDAPAPSPKDRIFPYLPKLTPWMSPIANPPQGNGAPTPGPQPAPGGPGFNASPDNQEVAWKSDARKKWLERATQA